MVTAEQITGDDTSIPHLLGPLTAGAGDWVLADGDDRWPIHGDIFDRVYWPAGSGKVRAAYKVPWTSLVPMPEEFEVLTIDSDELQHGAAGDFLAIGVERECWVIPARTVRDHFEPVDDPAPGKIKLFVSYSHSTVEDLGSEFLESLRSNFDQDDIAGSFHQFLDLDSLEPGDAWNYEITKAFAVADVVLIIVSDEWAKDPKGFARSRELPLAYQAREDHGTEIKPVIVTKRGIKAWESVIGKRGLDGQLLDIGGVSAKQLQDSDPTQIYYETYDFLMSISEDRAEHVDRRERRNDAPALEVVLAGLRVDRPAPTTPVGSAGSSPVARAGAIPSAAWSRAVETSEWVATMTVGAPNIVSIDGSGFLLDGPNGSKALRGSSSPNEARTALESIVAADDGSIVGAHSAGGFVIAETSGLPAWWPHQVSLLPDERVRAIRRDGRSYTLLLSRSDSHRTARLDSSGLLFSPTGPQGSRVDQAAADGLSFVGLTDNALTVGRLSFAGLPDENAVVLDVSSCTTVKGAHTVAAVVSGASGAALIVREAAGQRRWLPMPPNSTKSAVIQTAVGVQVAVQVGRSIQAWNESDLWPLDS